MTRVSSCFIDSDRINYLDLQPFEITVDGVSFRHVVLSPTSLCKLPGFKNIPGIDPALITSAQNELYSVSHCYWQLNEPL